MARAVGCILSPLRGWVTVGRTSRFIPTNSFAHTKSPTSRAKDAREMGHPDLVSPWPRLNNFTSCLVRDRGNTTQSREVGHAQRAGCAELEIVGVELFLAVPHYFLPVGLSYRVVDFRGGGVFILGMAVVDEAEDRPDAGRIVVDGKVAGHDLNVPGRGSTR